ncbi:uncharacterized protein B0H18DRAFT_1016462 [Fomitopsis serialis]|uniref:uncharacterized protein n=1 Tax=Fomitopsis serialis TaxID=139415 RepID=UPI00200857B6|nr:uncharacterized protein B0H18DRAFT_1028130 [Neoantrodia serialis]XP_047891704.1 uncharacterized protein B0H18DRAFT_1016462 [Neoantrodia serialis]KAH9919281.1 hypothetical protein B0H18DRAFT_1028130 [Neoantrodia serialis]KAH9922981.1 hypothetical protein B0H18DRAFT_1016462 [Neoantrodia serialis]
MKSGRSSAFHLWMGATSANTFAHTSSSVVGRDRQSLLQVPDHRESYEHGGRRIVSGCMRTFSRRDSFLRHQV